MTPVANPVVKISIRKNTMCCLFKQTMFFKDQFKVAKTDNFIFINNALIYKTVHKNIFLQSQLAPQVSKD